jgi:hypothetical protein
MAVNSISYGRTGGVLTVPVQRLPQVVADDLLVYFDHNKNRTSWAIRDFITGRKLDAGKPSGGHSNERHSSVRHQLARRNGV